MGVHLRETKVDTFSSYCSSKNQECKTSTNITVQRSGPIQVSTFVTMTSLQQ